MTAIIKNKKPDHAFILAAGRGTRLKPYTDTTPKPMVLIDEKPILEHTLRKLKNAEISNVTINLNYLGNVIETYFKGCTSPTITFSKEDILLDTGGGVKKALHTMENKPFFIINGDALWEEDKEHAVFDQLSDAWSADRMDILLLLQPINDKSFSESSGDYDIDAQGKAVRSLNKTGRYMFSGIRIASPHIFDNTPDGAFSFLELMDAAEQAGRLYATVHEGEWYHISTAADLERVNDLISSQNPKTAIG